VTELVEQTCLKVVWRNYARGTFWVYGEGTEDIEFDYMDITYWSQTGLIDAIGYGDVEFEFKGMVDTRFED